MPLVVRAQVPVRAPASRVFDYVTDWERQGEWIPLTRVEIVPDSAARDSAVPGSAAPGRRARYVGGRFRAWTGIGPVGFWDPLTVTVWEESPDGSGRCEILHTGSVVRGEAQFKVVATGPDTCTASLWERLAVPGGPGGALLWRLVGRFVGPLLDRGASRVLTRMARRAERRPR